MNNFIKAPNLFSAPFHVRLPCLFPPASPLQVLSGMQAEVFARRAGPGLVPHFTTGTFQIMTSLVYTVHCAVEWEVDDMDDGEEEEGRRWEARKREAEESPSGGWRECDGVQERKDLLKYDVDAANLTAMGMQYYMTYGGANDSTGAKKMRGYRCILFLELYYFTSLP